MVKLLIVANRLTTHWPIQFVSGFEIKLKTHHYNHIATISKCGEVTLLPDLPVEHLVQKPRVSRLPRAERFHHLCAGSGQVGDHHNLEHEKWSTSTANLGIQLIDIDPITMIHNLSRNDMIMIDMILIDYELHNIIIIILQFYYVDIKFT